MTGVTRNLPVVYLKPGEMHYTDQPTLVITVLGSCLSVTMHSSRLNVGGICHVLLPSCEKQKLCKTSCADKFKYVDCAVRHMVNLFERLGAERSELKVKYFGGADMFIRNTEKPAPMSVGRQNSIIAEKIIKAEGLRVVSKDVGGPRGRKILFYSHSGEVLLKRLTHVNDPDIRW